jgi:hypothetical protein
MSGDGKHARGLTRILTDSVRKRNRKEVLANYNKTRINIGHQHYRWMELKEDHALMLKCKHQCHCTCSSEIGTCINDDGRQAAHKKTNENTRLILMF